MSDARRWILERRARFLAAALAGIAPAACEPKADNKPPASPVVVESREGDADAGTASARPPETVVRDDGDIDTDGDGIPDKDDPCPTVRGSLTSDGTIDGCPHVCLTVVVGPPKILDVLTFASGSAALTPRSLEILDGLARTVVAHPEMILEVAGHAGENEKSSVARARADAVMKALVQRGAPADRMRAVDYGKSRKVGARVDFEVTEKP
jgi:outer membrane protein OmpA-like peptidoglycan-associated protein